MKELDLILHNPSGLHARPAKVFVNTAKQFKADIRVQHGTKKVNAKSMISVLTLGVENEGQIRLSADGPDEDEALAVLKAAIEAGLGDEFPAQESLADGKQTGGEIKAAPESQAQTEAARPKEAGSDERIVRGVPASSGIAIGPLHQFRKAEIVIEESAADPAQEKSRLQAAVKSAQSGLMALHAEVKKRIGAEEAAIFEAHQAILDDPELHEAAFARIDEGKSAGRAWQDTIQTTAATLAGLADELLSARATDVRDVGHKVLRILAGVADDESALPAEPVILVAEDLAPSDTASLDTSRVLGFCTSLGGANSHS
ncbi:MAG: HPr family phosphocarrier protein, partial [Chloroflexi bacterium]|nr:HPr family phosphocarrier protein [Chloroflexota bacterium]